jgi:hypothetical protein
MFKIYRVMHASDHSLEGRVVDLHPWLEKSLVEWDNGTEEWVDDDLLIELEDDEDEEETE